MSTSSIKSKLLRNLGANAYGHLITVVIQLVSVPLFLHYWGVELYGEWLILSAIPAYLSMSDIGFASVAANDMTIRMANGDQQGTLVVYQSIWVFICAMSLFVGAVLGIPILSFSINGLFSITHISSAQTSRVLFVLMLYVLVGLQVAVLNAGFRAVGRYAYGTIMNNSIRLIEWLISMLVLAMGGNVLFVAMAALIVRSLGLLILWIVLRVQTPWLNLGVHAASMNTIRELFKPAIAFMAFPLGLALGLQGTILLIGILLGSVAVAIFTAYRTLTRVLVQVITMLSTAIWPEASIAYGAGKMDLLSKLHHKGSKVTFWIAIACMAGLGLVGERIIGVWTHHAFQSHPILLWLLLATSFLNVLWQTSWVVLMATNMHQKISIVFFASATGGLATCALIIPLLGLNGAGLALVIAELPMLYLAVNGALNLLHDSWSSYAKAIISNPFARGSTAQ